MLKWILSLVLMLSPACVVGSDPNLDAIQKANAATLHIRQATIMDRATCSAEAIAPHALLTATHCEQATDALEIQEAPESTVIIVGRIRDNFDHTIMLVKGVTFDNYVNIDLTSPVVVGESVFICGNPGRWTHVLRKGYVAALLTQGNIFTGFETRQLFDFQVYYGDSGSGIFNSNGDIIAVVTGGAFQDEDGEPLKITLSYAFPLHFTTDDFKRARTFAN